MAVPQLVVVLLCVLGAGAVVVAVSAFGNHFFWKDNSDDAIRDWNQFSAEQGSYMKWVRDTNQMAIVDTMRAERAQTSLSGMTGSRNGRDSRYSYGASAAGRYSSQGHAHGHGGGAGYAEYGGSRAGYHQGYE